MRDVPGEDYLQWIQRVLKVKQGDLQSQAIQCRAGVLVSILLIFSIKHVLIRKQIQLYRSCQESTRTRITVRPISR